MFIRIDSGKEDFNIFKAINEIFRHIKESTIRLEFKSDNTRIPKATKYIVKKILPDCKQYSLILLHTNNNPNVFNQW